MSKAARAVEIYKEEAGLGDDTLRKRCIARFKSELAMSDAGAGTYFQNTKKKLATGDVLTLSPKLQTKSTVDIPTGIEVAAPGWSAFTTLDTGEVVTVASFATEEEAQKYAVAIEGRVIDRSIAVGEMIADI